MWMAVRCLRLGCAAHRSIGNRIGRTGTQTHYTTICHTRRITLKLPAASQASSSYAILFHDDGVPDYVSLGFPPNECSRRIWLSRLKSEPPGGAPPRSSGIPHPSSQLTQRLFIPVTSDGSPRSAAIISTRNRDPFRKLFKRVDLASKDSRRSHLLWSSTPR